MIDHLTVKWYMYQIEQTILSFLMIYMNSKN